MSAGPRPLASPEQGALSEESVFALHRGGKLETGLRAPVSDRAGLSLAYTPGVAAVCRALAADPALVDLYTGRGNTVAIVTDGSAVLGLGDIGPQAALPVMEGKAMLFKRFGGVDAVPLCLGTRDIDGIVDAVASLGPTFGGVNLEDIAAPRCFEIERRLQARLDVPVFHDDQHGTAVVVLAALLSGARTLGREVTSLRVVVSGAGAAGTAVSSMLSAAGVEDILVCDSRGILSSRRDDLSTHKRQLLDVTNRRDLDGGVADALSGADVFVGVSGGSLPESALAGMRPGGMIFALANPDPEVAPDVAERYAALVATGRSDQPNQINNVLAFPGIFRGALDVRARKITMGMKMAAAHALAGVLQSPNRDYFVPDVFDERVAPTVASAVATAARADGVARG